MNPPRPKHPARHAGLCASAVVMWRRWRLLLLTFVCLAAGRASELSVDFSRTNGVIRALHGVNLGPLCYRGMVDLSEYHRELRPPLTRLHDVVWVNYDAVDISTIFRDFRNDPALAESYTFAATDDYLAAIVAAGSPILYRLGESIEHTPRKYRVQPPADFAKWAEVCCQVIRHCNEGWAGGSHHDIRYWEIWNEPENQPAMWTGTDAQFFQLYAVTARAIKTRWPHLKVGGPSLGYTGEFRDGRFQPGEFLLRFLAHCRDERLPLDFFSWHQYAGNPAEIAPRARAIRELLDAHGFRQTESHLNEWNFLPNADWRPFSREGQGQLREQAAAELGGPKGAAFAAWALISLQDAPLDMANFYTAEIQMFGLFTINGVPRKNYHAFRAFRRLLDTPRRVATPATGPGGVALCAGVDSAGREAGILLSNFDDASPPPTVAVRNLPWPAPSQFELFLVDAGHDLQPIRNGALPPDGVLPIPELAAPSVMLLNLKPQAPAQP